MLKASKIRQRSQKRCDDGKKLCGIKRHLTVDINSLPFAIHITTANISERGGAVTIQVTILPSQSMESLVRISLLPNKSI